MVLKEMVVSLVMAHTTSGWRHMDFEEVSIDCFKIGLIMKEILNNLHEFNHESMYGSNQAGG